MGAADLAAEMDRSNPTEPLVVLDVRYRLGGPPGRADHEAAHLPGAVFVDIDTELAGTPGAAGRHPLPEPEALQAVLRGAGVQGTSRVVVHDDDNGSAAARAWWLLRWAGLAPDQALVLDGGFHGWVAAGLPTTAEPSSPLAGDVVVRPGGMPVLDADSAAGLARSGVLLDARAAARYRGETEPIDPVAGHVPGARNLPFTELTGPDGHWADPKEVAGLFAELGLGSPDDAGPEVGAYCGSGVTAATLVLAAEYAGIRRPTEPMALYVGSWSNWVADPARPVATGPTP
ncbi:sulfurtransferase [Actinomycetes bacterium KLBMP 9759]